MSGKTSDRAETAAIADNGKIEEKISRIELTKKIAYCSGEDFWHTKAMPELDLPQLTMCDGPHGLRKQDEDHKFVSVHDSKRAVCFPAAVSLACSRDRDLQERIGAAIGKEASNEDVALVLGPAINIKRNPLCGRNFEYYSEDPLLTAELATAFVKGLQSMGPGACLKHFATNNQEERRMLSDSIIEEQTLRQIYLSAFERVLKNVQVAAVMCSYNKINGVYASDNKYLLDDILRREFSFKGFVVSDWGGMNDRVKAFKAGCDLMMPGGSNYGEEEVRSAVSAGELPEKYIDRSIQRIYNFARNHKKMPQYEKKDRYYDIYREVLEENHDLAEEAAAKSAVLLKNDNKTLPLKCKTCAMIGYMAEKMRFQGSGSSHINAYLIDDPIDYLGEGYSYARGYNEQGETDKSLLAEARELAAEVETAVIVAGLPEAYESESFDRKHMRMPEGQNILIEEVAKVNKNTVVVLFTGSPVEMPWHDKVAAILYMGLPGEAGGAAMHSLLTGAINPSGKLAESWPLHYEDCPSASFYGRQDAVYTEGIFVGYRYYDAVDINLRYRFGHGLSYSKFVYEDLRLEGDEIKLKVINDEGPAGADAVEAYLESGLSNGSLYSQLIDFTKVYLEPGEAKEISLKIDPEILKEQIAISRGGFRIRVGKQTIAAEIKDPNNRLPEYYADMLAKRSKVSLSEYQEFLESSGDEAALASLKASRVKKVGKIDMNSTMLDLKQYSFSAKILYRIARLIVRSGFKGEKNENNPAWRMVTNKLTQSPIRSILQFAGMHESVIKFFVKRAANGQKRKLQK